MGVGKKLLVADDSLTIQKVIRLALSNEGYEIQAVSDGNDAIQQISLFRPDMILIDVSLPGKSAFDVKRAINEQGDFGETRFILMSSAFEKVDEEQAAAVEFHGRLTKPFDPAHLRQVLSDVLAEVAAKRRETTSLLERPAGLSTISLEPPSEIELNEEGFDPIQPADDQPVIQSAPASELVSNLWEEQETAAGESAPHDSDIKHLTESTIRMSGLDDFQWSVNEPARKEGSSEPSMPPYPNMADLSGAKFNLEPPLDDVLGVSMPAFSPEPEEPISAKIDQVIQPPPPPIAVPIERNAMEFSTAQLEELLEKRFRDTLENMAKKMLPDLAERLIKQEINRMLQERV